MKQNKGKTWTYTYNRYVKPLDAIDVAKCKKISVKSKRSVDLRLYRMTQNELRTHILSVLHSKKIPYTLYDGNIYSVRFDGKPLFVAHMDIIREESVHKPMFIDPLDNSLHRDGGTLGADDRAGINMILNHIDELNFMFARDEESGCLGTKSLMKNNKFLGELDRVNILIEPDRRNSSDIIQYCENDLIDKLATVLPTYKVANGLYTDVAQMDHIKPAVNLSCGYYEAHSSDEYLVIEEYEVLNDLIPELNKIEGTYEVTPYVPPAKTSVHAYTAWEKQQEEYWQELYGDAYTKEELGDFDLDELKEDEPEEETLDVLPSPEGITYAMSVAGKLDAPLFANYGYCDLCQYSHEAVAEIDGLYFCADCVSDIVTKLTKNEA